MTPSISSEPTWRISVTSTFDAKRREQILAMVRPQLERCIATNPGKREFVLSSPLGDITMKLHGTYQNNTSFRLAFDAQPLPTTKPPTLNDASGTILSLPDEATYLLGKRLFGLGAVRDLMLARMECAWDDKMAHYQSRSRQLPDALTQYFQQVQMCFLLQGVPGTGKSAIARVVCDLYCRTHHITGQVSTISLSKGNGLIGNFSETIWTGCSILHTTPPEEFCCLIIDECDVLMRSRSFAHQSKEDTDAVACTLREIDRLQGLYRRMLIGTTNLIDIDQAILRRSIVIPFEVPGKEIHLEMLKGWLPDMAASEIERRLVPVAAGLTPADIDRALSGVWVAHLHQSTSLDIPAIRTALCSARRTKQV